ncbi:MAG: hypothetical protein RIB65_00560 [Ilumatobacter fluminis]|uniref:hypothetical protein n=1 Tax=Ilumatobacter fluminis TaxID=467091 RepID=UPI0032EF03C2
MASEHRWTGARRAAAYVVGSVGLVGSLLTIWAFALDRPDDVKDLGRVIWTDRYPGWQLWALILLVVSLLGVIVWQRRSDAGAGRLPLGDEQVVDRYVEKLEGRAMQMMRTHNFHAAFDLKPINEAFFGASDLYEAPENRSLIKRVVVGGLSPRCGTLPFPVDLVVPSVAAAARTRFRRSLREATSPSLWRARRRLPL